MVAWTGELDFLGWHFKVKANSKFSFTSIDNNFKAFHKTIKDIVSHLNYDAKIKAGRLASLIRHWKHYYKYCDMNGTRQFLCSLAHRAFQLFNKERKLNRHSAVTLAKKAFLVISYKVNSFIKVKGTKDLLNGGVVYWAKRNSKNYDRPLTKFLRKQDHICGYCKQFLLDSKRIYLHYVDGNYLNWKLENLPVIHQSYHQYHHISNGYKQATTVS